MTLSVVTVRAAEVMVILDENVDAVIKNLTGGEGTPSKSADAFSGKESLFVGSTGGDGQKYNDKYPGLGVKIVENPKADNEFRYITWAWKKDGGEGLQLQLHGVPDTWGHRYHSGKNVKNWNPSLEADKAIPTKWTQLTKDLFKDWKAFELTGLAFTAWDGKGGFWDGVMLHKSANTPTAVEPAGKAAVTWGTMKATR
jgi:hypothetical protein